MRNSIRKASHRLISNKHLSTTQHKKSLASKSYSTPPQRLLHATAASQLSISHERTIQHTIDIHAADTRRQCICCYIHHSFTPCTQLSSIYSHFFHRVCLCSPLSILTANDLNAEQQHSVHRCVAVAFVSSASPILSIHPTLRIYSATLHTSTSLSNATERLLMCGFTSKRCTAWL